MMSLEEVLAKAGGYDKEKKYTEQLAFLTDDVLKQYNSADLYALKADAYFSTGEKELCDKANNMALQIDPMHANANNTRGNRFWEQKNYDAAIAAYKNAITTNPDFAYAYNGLGNVYFEQQKYEEAIAEYNNALRVDARLAFAYDGLGSVYSAMGLYDKAIAAYRNAIEIEPLDAFHYNELGNIYYYKYDFGKAIELYNKAIELDAGYYHAYNGLGNCYHYLKDYEKAISNYTKAVELEKNFTYAHTGLGNCYYALKEYDKAINSYKKSLALAESDDVHNGLGNCYYYLRDYETAISHYNKALEMNPHYANALNGLGNCYLGLYEYEKAMDYYEKSIEADDTIVYPHEGLGICFNNLGENEKAIEQFLTAIEKDPQFAAPYIDLTNIYIEQNDYSLAKKYFDKYVELNNGNLDYDALDAQAKIEKLKKSNDNTYYANIERLVNEIKKILLFEGKCVTHYTGLSGAKAMILKNSRLRLSEGAFLNDTSEGKELYDYLQFGGGYEEREMVDIKPFAQKPFIGSFVDESKNNDLALWRMYGKENKEEAIGCAITLDRVKFISELKKELTKKAKSKKNTAAPAEETDNPDLKAVNISGKTVTSSTSKNTGNKNVNNELFNFYRVAYCTKGNNARFVIPGVDDPSEEALNRHMQDLHLRISDFKASLAAEDAGTKEKLNLDIRKLLNEISYLFKGIEYQYEHELRLIVRDSFEGIVYSDEDPPKVRVELVTLGPLIRGITMGPKVPRAEEWAAAFYYKLGEYYKPEQMENRPQILISHLPFK